LKSAARRGEGVVMRPSGRWKTRGDAQVQVSMVGGFRLIISKPRFWNMSSLFGPSLLNGLMDCFNKTSTLILTLLAFQWHWDTLMPWSERLWLDAKHLKHRNCSQTEFDQLLLIFAWKLI